VLNQAIRWETLKEILAGDFPGVALRPMHRLGLLTEILPEFRAIDSLVVRDFYHRYTVDEHSLRTIEHLQELAEPPDERGHAFAPLWKTLERRDLLIFALLLHDLGKDIGPGQASHVYRSGELAEVVCERMGLPGEQRRVIQLLTVHHLAMNRIAQRRDITDEKVIAEFASMVETVSGLEQLYLLTFADTSAVGPDGGARRQYSPDDRPFAPGSVWPGAGPGCRDGRAG